MTDIPCKSSTDDQSVRLPLLPIGRGPLNIFGNIFKTRVSVGLTRIMTNYGYMVCIINF